MRTALEKTGFATPAAERSPALAELVATAGLSAATIVTAIVVSAGIARADVADGVIGNEGGIFAIALVLGLAFIGMSGLTLSGSRTKRH
ncbi:MAG TPA: hypothetical protein VFB31_02410 [Pseudolabrys sp.]|nr:hypothetical protein [Pseudolabrys sp.]